MARVERRQGRLWVCWLALPLLLAPLLIAPLPVEAAPATDAEMNLFGRIAAVNACIARAAGVEFDKAVAISGETIAQVIQGQHGGAIAQVSDKPLTPDELRKGAINSAVLGAVELCPKEVPADVMKRVQDALKQAGPAGSVPKPAAKP